MQLFTSTACKFALTFYFCCIFWTINYLKLQKTLKSHTLLFRKENYTNFSGLHTDYRRSNNCEVGMAQREHTMGQLPRHVPFRYGEALASISTAAGSAPLRKAPFTSCVLGAQKTYPESKEVLPTCPL